MTIYTDIDNMPNAHAVISRESEICQRGKNKGRRREWWSFCSNSDADYRFGPDMTVDQVMDELEADGWQVREVIRPMPLCKIALIHRETAAYISRNCKG